MRTGRLPLGIGPAKAMPKSNVMSAPLWTSVMAARYDRLPHPKRRDGASTVMHEPSVSASAKTAVALAGVNLTLGRGRARVHILRDVDFYIGQGEAIGLLGASGSGKSTLLMVIAGLERADTGVVAVSGRGLNRLDGDGLARFRAKNIGIVFQSFHLIPTMTAVENVAVPLA